MAPFEFDSRTTHGAEVVRGRCRPPGRVLLCRTQVPATGRENLVPAFQTPVPPPCPPLCVYLKKCMGSCTGIGFVDSTSLKVCHNRRISRHRVFKGLAHRGKTSVDWFFGDWLLPRSA